MYSAFLIETLCSRCSTQAKHYRMIMVCKDDKSKTEERDYKFNAENELERSSFLDAVKKCKLAEQESKSAADVSNYKSSSLMDMEIAMGEVSPACQILMPIKRF